MLQRGVAQAWEKKLASSYSTIGEDLVWHKDTSAWLELILEMGPSAESTAQDLAEAAYCASDFKWNTDAQNDTFGITTSVMSTELFQEPAFPRSRPQGTHPVQVRPADDASAESPASIDEFSRTISHSPSDLELAQFTPQLSYSSPRPVGSVCNGLNDVPLDKASRSQDLPTESMPSSGVYGSGVLDGVSMVANDDELFHDDKSAKVKEVDL